MEDERLALDRDTVARSAIRTSDDVGEIIPALLKAQKKIDHVGKDATAKVKTKGDKPDYSYGYTTLAHVLNAIKGPLNENGIIFVQGTSSKMVETTYYGKPAVGMEVTVTTRFFHTGGQWIETSLTMVAADTSPQAIGSCVTYGRRYTAQPLGGLASEDDDGAAAQPKVQKTGTKKQETKVADEEENKLKAEAAFFAEWDRVMLAIGEDDADNSKALRHLFIKKTTEASPKFLAITDSMAALSSNEVNLLTRIVKENHEKTVGECAGAWREELKLPSLGVEVCAVCGEALTDAEKSGCAVAGIKPHCDKHSGDALKEKFKGRGKGEGV